MGASSRRATARAEWVLSKYGGYKDARQAAAVDAVVYHLLVGGRWRIKRTAYKRTYEEVWKRSAPAPQTLTASWFDTGGQSQLPVPEHVAKLPRSSLRKG